jgi:hypothetical protein
MLARHTDWLIILAVNNRVLWSAQSSFGSDHASGVGDLLQARDPRTVLLTTGQVAVETTIFGPPIHTPLAEEPDVNFRASSGIFPMEQEYRELHHCYNNLNPSTQE